MDRRRRAPVVWCLLAGAVLVAVFAYLNRDSVLRTRYLIPAGATGTFVVTFERPEAPALVESGLFRLVDFTQSNHVVTSSPVMATDIPGRHWYPPDEYLYVAADGSVERLHRGSDARGSAYIAEASNKYTRRRLPPLGHPDFTNEVEYESFERVIVVEKTSR